MKNTSSGIKILVFDIGGSTIKATVLNEDGDLLQEYRKLDTPNPGSPQKVLEQIKKLASGFEDFDKISVGFPGYVKKGIVSTAPNLGTELWKNINLNKLISDALKKPVRIANDADLQGLGVVSQEGLEMVLTLGTGFGTALLMDGNLLPHLELAHLPVTKKKTYDEYVGDDALEDKGLKKWNDRMEKIICNLKTVFNYDRLYIGGGNADKLDFKLDENIALVKNRDGIKGGARLWDLDEKLFMNIGH